jgi:hypothetical protein
LTGTDRATASEQINVTRELPSSEADYAGWLVRRDIHYANIARDDHEAVEGLAARTKDFLARGERAACAELRTFRQLSCGENRKGHRVRHQIGLQLIWGLVHHSKALPLFNIFVGLYEIVSRGIGVDGSGLGARGHLGGPRQCLRVDILPDVRQIAISNGNVEDPVVLKRLIRGFDSPLSEPNDQNPVSLRYELGGLWERSFYRFVSLLK